MKTITFYSFKGGVGRTALLTNLGVYWATLGKVVALMDLDLAAPGLSYSPLLGDYLDQRGAGLGMTDLLNVFRRNIDDPEDISLLPPRLLLREMRLPEGRAGRLLAIGAGDAVYQAAATGDEDDSAIPGQEPQADESSDQAAFRALAENLKADLAEWRVPEGPAAGRGIDYLLIDARTGYSELRDLSLGYLADHMVIVSGLNEQNLRGLSITQEALTRNRISVGKLPEALSVVFSPVPAGDDEAAQRALKRGKRTIDEGLRLTGGHQPEPPPNQFVLHYTPILAMSDRPVLLDFSEGLYASEIRTIAERLDLDTSQAEVQAESRGDVKRLLPPDKTDKIPYRPSTPQEDAVNPLLDLPAWDWPLSGNGEERKRFLEKAAFLSIIKVDRERFLHLLAWSLSLSLDEKQRVIDAMPTLSQFQVDELIKVFTEEYAKFLELQKDHPGDIVKLMQKLTTEWAVLTWRGAGEAVAGMAELIRANPVSSRWKPDERTWALLAHVLLQDERETEAGEALGLGVRQTRDVDELLKDFVAGTRSESSKAWTPSPAANYWNALLRLAQAAAPNRHWWRYGVASRMLQGEKPARERALDVLPPLLELEHPSEEAEQCWELGVLVLKELPELARQAETALRRAAESKPDNARYVNAWGNLLRDHLLRYDEAEAAYRRAIEIDAKWATPQVNLGRLLAGHLQRYEEAEAAYQQAIEHDAKNAYLWNSFGLFLLSQGRCTDARTAFQTGLDLGETSERPYLLMNLGHLAWQLGERQAAEEHLREALSAFADGEDKYGNALRLALELREEAMARRELEKLQGKPEKYVAWARLLAALLEDEPQALAEQRRLTLATLDSYNDLHDLVEIVYRLCGFRPEARAAGRALVADLLALPPELCEHFRDQPKPDALWARYRPFAEGHSEGAGDPADLPLFCRDAAPAA